MDPCRFVKEHVLLIVKALHILIIDPNPVARCVDVLYLKAGGIVSNAKLVIECVFDETDLRGVA